MYQIQMQFLPGYNNIWVNQLNPEDILWEFDNEADAISKAEELQAADQSGRQYKVYNSSAIEETPIVEVPIEETPTEELPVEGTLAE
jgi:hypothetical protein